MLTMVIRKSNGDYIVPVIYDLNVTDNMLDEYLVTALEGGSNHWLKLGECPEGMTYNDMRRALISGELCLPCYDREDGTFLGSLDKAAMLRAFQAMPARHIHSVVNGSYDAETTDVWMQLAVMNEIVYG